MVWSSRRVFVGGAACVGALLVGALGWHWLNTWGFRKKLPWSASDIHEEAWEDGFLPDYDYALKARITEAEFLDYIQQLGLTPHTPTRHYGEDPELYLNWGHGETGWWDPSESLEKTFVRQGGDTWTFAKYEHGCIYLRSLNH